MNKDIISEFAQSLFYERGVKAVNVDDIAKGLGISKKTIYIFFSSKDEIVEYQIDAHIAHHICDMEAVKADSKNAIGELFLIYRMNCSQHKALKPIFIADVQRYYPQCWKKMEKFLEEKIPNIIRENILRGKKEGYYKQAVNEDFIAFLYFKSIFNLIEYFTIQKKHSITELDREHMHYHIHAIGTDKGIQYLDKLNFDD